MQRFKPCRACPFDIIGHRITDHQSGARLHFQSPTSLKVGLSVRLRMTHLHGGKELHPWQVESARLELSFLHLPCSVRQHTDDET